MNKRSGDYCAIKSHGLVLERCQPKISKQISLEEVLHAAALNLTNLQVCSYSLYFYFHIVPVKYSTETSRCSTCQKKKKKEQDVMVTRSSYQITPCIRGTINDKHHVEVLSDSAAWLINGQACKRVAADRALWFSPAKFIFKKVMCIPPPASHHTGLVVQ